MKAADIHIVVHGLLFGSRNNGNNELGKRIGKFLYYASVYFVVRMARFGNGRSARSYFRIAARKSIGVYTQLAFE